VVYMRAGPEIGVAATKTYTSQIMSLSLLTLFTALEGGVLDRSEVEDKLVKLSRAHEITAKAIEESLKHVPENPLVGSKSIYMLGRGLGSLIAREAALKVKEIAYIHAESYPAGESKHGPIALVEKGFPVYFVATSDSPEIAGNVMEMRARGAHVTIVKASNWRLDVEPGDSVEIVEMPLEDSEILLEPYPLIPYFQVLAYRASVARGYNPDKPRNLAKTVTVE
jgi:glucosamine--fructose-6-phosphate aminotransferase (isomerizing)